MGRGRKGSGVELRETSIRLSFTWQGQRCRETLDRHPTPANIKYAERLAAEINRKIDNGTFDYAEYFPHSKKVQEGASTIRHFGTLCDSWLKTKGRLAAATLSQYRNALNFWKEQLGADRLIDSITHGKVAEIVGGYPWASAKLCNNYLIPLRGVFKLAGRDIKGLDNPVEGIENAKQQKAAPDPLSLQEMVQILGHMTEHYPLSVSNYFGFAFCTGMRPEELIALEWRDVDWRSLAVRVERAKSFRGQVKPLKTYESRDVDLTEAAMLYLRRQKTITFQAGGAIFGNPVTGQPWHDERSQRDHYWKPTLKRLGIRMRRAYQTRHTYATTALMAGVNPSYIARQMGHRSAKMLYTVYAKWIDGADRGREKAKMEAVLTTEFVPNLSQESKFSQSTEGKLGRRDWTRTNPKGNTLPHKKKTS
jgi:integrase